MSSRTADLSTVSTTARYSGFTSEVSGVIATSAAAAIALPPSGIGMSFSPCETTTWSKLTGCGAASTDTSSEYARVMCGSKPWFLRGARPLASRCSTSD